MTHPLWNWLLFGAVVALAIVIDLVAHREDREESQRRAYLWSALWIAVGLGFGVFVWAQWGPAMAQEYLAAYLIEKSLSLDNLFVFLVIFSTLKIPRRLQRMVLVWGILGALFFRAVFIFLGAAAIERWDWVAYVFGALLLFTAWRIFRDDPLADRESRIGSWISQHLPVTAETHGHHFLVRRGGRRMATPLLVALLAIEVTDILFAIDSVPAAFAVTHDRFILYSSNAFAILGLRALYIALAGTLERFKYLHYGLALILAFAAVKLILNDQIHVPPFLSVALIAAVLVASIAFSLLLTRSEEGASADPEGDRSSQGSPPSRRQEDAQPGPAPGRVGRGRT